MRSGTELQNALVQIFERNHVQSLYVSQAALFLIRRWKLVDLAASKKVPAIYPFREFVQSGGLVTYRANLPDMYGRAAACMLTKFSRVIGPLICPCRPSRNMNWVVNLDTAKPLGLETV